MTNRIGGDFGPEAMEAFRVAYAQQLATPDQDEIANNSGLPTNVVANTSPWIEHTGLWKYPSGKGPDEDLKTAFNPNDYLSGEVIDGDGEIDSMDESDLSALSDEEFEELLEEAAGEEEEEIEG